MTKRKKGIPGLSFSWRRAIGLTAAKRKLSNKIGIPTTRAGRQRKLGKAMGCCVPFIILITGFSITFIGITKVAEIFLTN